MSTGFVLWFTGLSGSGKSTLTAMVSAELRRRGVHVEALDGDEVRKNLSKGLGFSKEDRDTNIRRLGFVANLIARSGGCAITAAISPYRSVRDEVRRSAERFCEVYCECPLSVLTARDPKGLYDKALRGEIKNFTGVDDPYEAPEHPEVHLHTDQEPPEASALRVVRRLEELGLVATIGGRVALPRGDDAQLLPPHGGELSERALVGDAAAREMDRALGLPQVALDAEAESWLAAFATGALSPLTGFIGERDYLRITREARLERGLFWPVPPLLRLTEQQLAGLPVGCREVALTTLEGRALATLRVSEIWRRDAAQQSAAFLAGDVNVFELPAWCQGVVSARAVRAQLAERGASKVVALRTARAPSLADEYLARSALELADAVLFLPAAERAAPWPVAARARAFQGLADDYFPKGRALSAAVPAPLGVDEPRLTWLSAIIAQNYGASRLLIEANAELDAAPPAALRELGVECVRCDPVVFSLKLAQLATTRSAPDRGEVRLPPQSLDEMAGSGLFRPEVISVLRQYLSQQGS